MNTSSERGSEKCLRKSLSETIGLIVVLYGFYLLANLIASGYINDQLITKVLQDLWRK